MKAGKIEVLSSPRDTRGTNLAEVEQACQTSQINSQERPPRPLNSPSAVHYAIQNYFLLLSNAN